MLFELLAHCFHTELKHEYFTHFCIRYTTFIVSSYLLLEVLSKYRNLLELLFVLNSVYLLVVLALYELFDVLGLPWNQSTSYVQEVFHEDVALH